MAGIWRFFSSVYLTIVLAIAICAVSAWGSIISMRNPELFRAFDQEVLFPLLFSLGTRYLGLTLWVWALIVLTALFAVNTAVCTLDKVLAIVRNRRPWQAFFPHIVHVGFLIALVGHLVGSIWGFRSYGNVLHQGEVIPVPNQPGLYVRLDGTEVKATPSGELDYLKTSLTLLGEDNMPVRSGAAGINSPLIYRGIAFYHFDQGERPTGLVLDVDGAEVRAELEGTFSAPDGSAFRMGGIYPDFAIDETGQPYNRSERFANPHMEIISADGTPAYLDLSGPGPGVRLGRHTIILRDYIYSPYVVLTINKDPGIIFIIAGSIVLIAGMVLLLFFRGERTELVRQRPGTAERAN
ncbi:MAG TPA: cytochrome c biogenesis protein ResB [Thermodesulfobacteriota bacterium]